MKTSEQTPQYNTSPAALRKMGVEPLHIVQFMLTTIEMQEETLELIGPTLPPDDYIRLKDQLRDVRVFFSLFGADVFLTENGDA